MHVFRRTDHNNPPRHTTHNFTAHDQTAKSVGKSDRVQAHDTPLKVIPHINLVRSGHTKHVMESYRALKASVFPYFPLKMFPILQGVMIDHIGTVVIMPDLPARPARPARRARPDQQDPSNLPPPRNQVETVQYNTTLKSHLGREAEAVIGS